MGRYFSLWKDVAPFPPRPARTWITASSTNELDLEPGTDASIGSAMSPEPVTAWLVRARDRGDAGAVTLRLEEGGSAERAAEAIRLAQANRELKPVVEEWVRAIREAAGIGA